MATNANKHLDKSKPYGTIRGRFDDFPNARYSQEDRLYDANGELIRVGKKDFDPEIVDPPANPLPAELMDADKPVTDLPAADSVKDVKSELKELEPAPENTLPPDADKPMDVDPPAQSVKTVKAVKKNQLPGLPKKD